jgi:predicted peroxiredoxin
VTESHSVAHDVTVFLVASGVDWVRKGAGAVAHLNPLDPTMDDLLEGVTIAGAPAMLEVVKDGAATLSS